MRLFLVPPSTSPVAAGSVPTFSIVIPAFQAAGFIGRAVESALDQTVPAVEIIVFDDGSTDDLHGALAPYGDRVRLERGVHSGLSAARNRGFRLAAGDFVANLDADDVLDKEWLAAVGELAAARPDLDILTTDSFIVQGGRRVRRCYSGGWVFATDDQRQRIVQQNFLTSIAAVRRARFLEIGGFDESIRSAEDWDFWLRLILDGSRAGCVAEPLAEYTVREGSMSTQSAVHLQNMIRVLEKVPDEQLELREREVLELTLAVNRKRLALLQTQRSLVRGESDARRQALALARRMDYPVLTRLKLVGSTLAPGIARRELERRGEQEWVGAGGMKVKRHLQPVGDGTLRVAFYSDSGEIGGAEASLANLVAALGPRIQAVVVGVDRRVVEWVAGHRPAATTVLLPRIRSEWDLGAMAAHFRAFRRLRPHILHVNLNATGASPWAILSGRATRGPRIVAVEHLPLPIRSLRRRLLERLVAPCLTAHVAVGDRSAGEVARFMGVPRSSIRTIHNGVPELDVEPLPRHTDGPVIGSLGRLDEQKGFDVLVRALAELPDVTAVVVGEGSERDRLVQLGERLGVSEQLVLPGWSDEARRYLTAFDVFVLPSRFEGFPLVVVEAMLAGLPVVATDVGSVSEALLEGETGVLVPAEDPAALARAVRDLLADPARAREMGLNGRRRALARFTVAAMAGAYEALWDEVVR